MKENDWFFHDYLHRIKVFLSLSLQASDKVNDANIVFIGFLAKAKKKFSSKLQLQITEQHGHA